MKQFAEGQRVVVAEFDNGDEIIPEEFATIIRYQGNGMYTIQVDTPRDEDDDCVRECEAEQLSELDPSVWAKHVATKFAEASRQEHSYITKDFEPHDWVVSAVLYAYLKGRREVEDRQ